MSRHQLSPIPDKGMKPYPLPRDLRMPTHYFIAWWHNRWLNSTLHLTGSYEVQGVALALYCTAQNQSPMGALPADDVLLARLLRIDFARWQDLRRAAVSPLHGWYMADCEGEVRWAHPVVLEMLIDAQNRAESRCLSNEERAVQKRIERLRAALAELGVDKAVLDNCLVIEAMDEWLEVNWKKRRNSPAHSRLLRWASSSWLLSIKANSLL